MRINFTGKKVFGFVLTSLLSLSGLTTAAQRTQPPAPVDSEWSFSVKQGQTAQSDITARNICFKRHRFQVELRNLPFMTLVGPATFEVNAGSEYKAPVRIDASGLRPGDYEGTAVVMCETCPREKGCTQDRQNLRVRMTVTERTPMPAMTVEDQKKIDRLIQQLGADDIGERDEAQQELIKIGAPAIPSLEKALSDPDLERRTNAAAVLARILGTVTEAESTSAQSLMQCVLDKPFVLISQTRISSTKDLSPILERVAPTGKPLLILAEDVEGEAIASIVVNRLRGTSNICAVKASGFGDRSGQLLWDIAGLTGGKVIGGPSGPKLETAQINDLGRAGKVVAYRDQAARIDHIFIIDSEGDLNSLENLAAQVRDAYERKDVLAGYLHLYLAALYKLAGRPLPSGLPPLPEPEPRKRFDFVMVSRTAPVTVTPQPSPSETILTTMPQEEKQKCDCTITARFPNKGGKDNKDKKRKVTVAEGKASVEFGISGAVKTKRVKDQKVHPIVYVKYYFTLHNVPAKGAPSWGKASDPQILTVDLGELPCDGKETPFEKWFSVPVPAGPKGQANVAYELHLYAYSTKVCPMTPVRGFLKFVVSYDDKGKANDRPKNDKDAQDEFPYVDNRSPVSGFGFDEKGNMVLPKPK